MCALIKQKGDESAPFVTVDRVESPDQLFRTRDWKPRYNAAREQELLVFRLHPEHWQPVEGMLRWGLIPHWMKALPDIRPINARAESIGEKRMFAVAYAKRRCIVPMDAFYEWQRIGGKKKQPYAFAMKDRTAFGVAGIWENWRNPFTGQWERTFAIITVPANKLVAEIHDRMPAILAPKDHSRWYSTELDPRDLLQPYPADLMTMWPVSKRLNSIENDDPTLIVNQNDLLR
jgi:putative SOS response-associated peptidase YedK